VVPIAPDEAARRARAAIAYAGLDYEEVCRRTGITEGTLRNIVSKTRPSGGSQPRLHKIAIACKVPPDFMDVGFEPLKRPVDDLTARLIELERSTTERLDELQERYGRLAEAIMPDRGTDPGAAVEQETAEVSPPPARSSGDSEAGGRARRPADP
jgi:transcriptional regulator with XRE-family HTH domain